MNFDRMNQILEAFDACPAFDIFTLAEKTQLARQARIISYRENQEVFSFEHRGDGCFFLVAKGTFKLQLRTKQSRPYNQGEIFGEIAIFNEKSRTGTIWAVTDGELVAISRDSILREGLLPSELRYKLTFILAQKMADYFHDGSLATSQDLIARGESEVVEFKSTANYKDDIAQALCAFMNHRGGTLFVGVDDNGKVFGLGDLSKQEIDEYRRNIGTTLRQRIGSFDMRKVYIGAEKVFGKLVLRIDCVPSETPVFFKAKHEGKETQELFFVRHDTRNEEIKSVSEIVRYVHKRFPEQG